MWHFRADVIFEWPLKNLIFFTREIKINVYIQLHLFTCKINYLSGAFNINRTK